MTQPSLMPSLEYLLTCSGNSLEQAELSALNRAGNCMKAAKLEWEQAVAWREVAGVARWLIENRDKLLAEARRSLEAHAIETFFPDPAALPEA